MGVFQPAYVFPQEYQAYGLPSALQQPDIDNLVCLASTMIDEYCGRTDGDGNGSLVYTTYLERIMSQSPGRNLYYLPQRPLVGITADTVADLQALDAASGGFYYTGVQPSVNNICADPGNSLSAIIGASGRYAFPRRDVYPLTNDPYSYVNPLTIVTLFGGPPPWIGIDMQNLSYDAKTGEIWIASGMWLERYTEVCFQYNAGYDPRNMPKQVKLACAALVKNLMAKGSGTTGMTSFTMGRSGVTAQFTEDVFDANIARLLAAFMTTRIY